MSLSKSYTALPLTKYVNNIITADFSQCGYCRSRVDKSTLNVTQNSMCEKEISISKMFHPSPAARASHVTLIRS